MSKQPHQTQQRAFAWFCLVVLGTLVLLSACGGGSTTNAGTPTAVPADTTTPTDTVTPTDTTTPSPTSQATATATAHPTATPTSQATATPTPRPTATPKPTPTTPKPTPTPIPQQVTVNIVLTSKKCNNGTYSFSPPTETIPVGSTVTWKNLTPCVSHTATDGVFDSGIIIPGGSYTFKFTKAGSYPYHCQIHPSMTGTITITGVLQQDTGKRDSNKASVTLEALSPYSVMLLPLGITIAAIVLSFLLRKKRQYAYALSSDAEGE